MHIALMLLLIGTGHATTFFGVPERCQVLLTEVGEAGLRDVVDWRPLYRHIDRFGLDPLRPGGYLGFERTSWTAARATEIVREARRDPRWAWGDPLDAQDSEAIGASRDFAPRDLPLWAALRGFTASSAMHGHFAQGRRAPDEYVLVATAPLWLEGPDAVAVADLYWARLGASAEWECCTAVVRETLPNAEGIAYARRAFDHVVPAYEAVRQSSQLILRASTVLPFSEYPPRVGDQPVSDWIDLDRHPPLQLESVDTLGYATNRAGHCDEMTEGHLVNALQPPLMNSIVAVIDGHVVGVIKRDHLGDLSMLALRTVIDARGHLRLVIGGVYQLPRGFSDDHLHGGPRRLARWRPERLAVRPTAFVLDDLAYQGRWGDYEDLIMALIAKNPLVADRSAGEVRAREFLRRGDKARDGAIEKEIWFALQDALSELREGLERTP
jgi:hypothetical protein